MSEHSKSKNAYTMLLAFHQYAHHLARSATTAEHSLNPAVTILLRLAGVFLLLAICGPLARHALGSLSAGVILAFLLLVGVRIGIYFLRRHQQL
ncbi:hypothetical protein Rhe02_47130 [Rhizocola hellebori]|uniref:Uncharacterized protein n=1 Tax=Rhizocola hellebori TaxID=1392758 RepID=A0A8J3Q9Z6_9ACTN|nr:hypothetical protein [Rhizocola hellebori]GIH06646.1 hypothetical protein Rhe02_47130 [Rhizocola hellebori]